MIEVFTVGHSNHGAEHFRKLLRAHDVSAVADVRSSPYSRMSPQFNREILRRDLRAMKVSYVFLGVELGARTNDQNCYVDGKVQYDRLSQTAVFEAGIERVLAGACKHRIALLCAEKDPLTCHRCILVARQLESRGASVKHILSDGNLETQDESLDRLLRVLGIQERDLFRRREELLSDAYRIRGEQIAYVGKMPTSERPLRRAAR